MGTNSKQAISMLLPISGLVLLGSCSDKVTDPADLSEDVVEWPEDPTEKEKLELYKKLEELKEHNERYTNAPTRKQREVAKENLDKIAEAKEELGIKVGGKC